MLDQREFLPQAQALPIGQRKKVDHCGDGACMIVSHEPACYRAYCFRCGEPGYVRKERNLQEIMASLQAQKSADDAARQSPELPEDCVPITLGWPDWARVWLAKAGLGSSDVERLGFLYSPRMARVVLPVYDKAGALVFWQARGNKVDPKYISPWNVDRSRVIPAYGPQTGIILVAEDVLSAAKVGQVNEAWSLMGTSMSDPFALALLTRGVKVIMALDPDGAGIRGAAKACRALAAYGVDVVNITRELPSDPKLMSRDSIRCLIKEVASEHRW